MDMTFSVGGGVQFGFDVGGSYVPPEPEPPVPVAVGVVNGTIIPICTGGLSLVDVIEGTMVLEE